MAVEIFRLDSLVAHHTAPMHPHMHPLSLWRLKMVVPPSTVLGCQQLITLRIDR